MLLRRLLLLVAVLLGLTALAASIAPRDETGGDDTQEQVRPLASPSPEGKPAPAPGVDVRATLSEQALKTRRVRATVGQIVRLEVRGYSTDFVAIEDLGLLEPMDPDTTTELEFLAERPGMYPVTVSERRRPIGLVVVTAAATAG